MTEHHREAFDLAHGFMNQTRDFVLGFEAGRFWADCGNGDEVEGHFHASNEGELLRIAEHHGFRRERWDPVGTFAHGVFHRSSEA